MNWRTSLMLVSLVALAELVHPSVAFAAEPDDATRTRARSLGEEGNARFDQGDFKGALELYDRASALVNVPTLGLKSARCLVKLGRWIEASERYLAVTRMTLPPDALDVHKEAVSLADTERAALLPKIPNLVVHVATTKAFSTTLDGKPLPAALLDVKVPVDPGEHTIVATSAGGTDTSNVTLAEAELREVSLALAADGPAAPPLAPKSGGDTGGRWLSPIHGVGIASLALGAAGLGAGIGTTVVLAGKKSDLQSRCGAELKSCPRNDADAASYNALRVPSTVAWVLGGVFATAGVVFVALPNPKHEKPGATAMELGISPTSMSFRGRF